MISFTAIAVIVTLHFLADFVFQNDKMATNKSSNNFWLFVHTCVYAITFFIGAAIFLPISITTAAIFAAVNGVLHFVVDYISSRGTSYLWKQGERHWFFVTIGGDQAIHMLTLFATYIKLLG